MNHRAGIHTVNDKDGSMELSITDHSIIFETANEALEYPIDGSADYCLIRTFLKFASMIQEKQDEMLKGLKSD